MSTLLDIKTSVASYLNVTPSELTQNGQDLFLMAANQVRKSAELNHDFEFNRRLVTVSVNGTTGGDLGAALDADDVAWEIKTVLEVGLLDEQLNLIPVDWTTTAESLERQRGDNGYFIPRYPTDGWARATPGGVSRFTFSGDTINRWPKTPDSEVVDFTLWLEAYVFTTDWTIADLTPGTVIVSGTLSPDATGSYTQVGTWLGAPLYTRTADSAYIIQFSGAHWTLQTLAGGLVNQIDCWNRATTSILPAGTYGPHGTYTGTATVTETQTAVTDIWTTHGQQYLTWAVVVQLNKLFMRFVQRQEGVLPPPTELAAEGLQSLLDWDNNKYEQFRRHGR